MHEMVVAQLLRDPQYITATIDEVATLDHWELIWIDREGDMVMEAAPSVDDVLNVSDDDL